MPNPSRTTTGRTRTARTGFALQALLLLAMCWSAHAGAAAVLTPVFSGPASYTPGTTVANAYVLTVSNSGDTATTTARVQTNFPAGVVLQWSCAASAGSDCVGANSGTGNINRPGYGIAVGGTLTFTFTSTQFPSSMSAAPLLVTATVTDTNATPGEATDQVSSTLSRVADISVQKTSASSTYAPGGSDSYTVVVSNAGPSDLSGITLVDSAPTGMTILNWTCAGSGGASCSNASGSGNLSQTIALPSGGGLTYTLPVAFATSATANPLQNTASVTLPAGANDPDSTDHSSTHSKARQPRADFGLAFVPASPPTAATGRYTPGTQDNPIVLRITNHGPSNSNGAELSVQLPSVPVPDDDPLPLLQDLQWSCLTPSACSIASGSGTDAIATEVSLAAGASVDLEMEVAYASGLLAAQLDFIAVVDSADLDQVAGNDQRTQRYLIERKADIAVSKDSGLTLINPGTDFHYDIVLSNAGPSDVGNGPGVDELLLSDTLPPELQANLSECVPGATLPCWAYCPTVGVDFDDCTVDLVRGSGNISNLAFAVAAGSSTTVRVYASVGPNAPNNGQISNTATVALGTDGITETGAGVGNSSTDTVTVVVSSDIGVSKTDAATSAVPGQVHSYKVTVRNDGFVAVDDVRVTDALPLYQQLGDAGFVAGSVTWQCSAFGGACCNHNSSSCGAPQPTTPLPADGIADHGIDLPGQSRVEFTFTGTLDARATGTLSNTASIVSPDGVGDPDPNNNSATDDDTVLQPVADLSLSKALLSLQESGQGYQLSYQIVVANAGPSRVAGAIVRDLLEDTRLDEATAQWSCSVTADPGHTACGDAAGSGVLDTTVDLDVGGEVRFVLDVSTTAGATGEIINTARILSPAGGATDTVTSGLAGESALSISKTDNLAAAQPGTALEYTIRVQNAGPDDIFGLRVVDTLPAELEAASWTCQATTPVPGDLEPVDQVGAANTAGGALVVSADGRHAYQVATGTASLYAYDRNNVPGNGFGNVASLETETEGNNDISDPGAAVSGMHAPIAIAMHPAGNRVYVLSQALDDKPAAMAVFNRVTNSADPNYGRLSFAGTTSAGVPAAPRRLAVAPQSLYISAATAVSVFTLDPVSGLPQHDADHSAGAAWQPGAMVVSPQQALLLVGSDDAPHLRLFAIGSGGGAIPPGRLAQAATLQHQDHQGIEDLLLGPERRQVYLAASGAAALSVVDYTATSLAQAASYDATALSDLDGVGADPFAAPGRLAVAPDGEHLFLSSRAGFQLLQLRRDTDNGLLDPEAMITRSTVGTQPADRADGVQVTPDGRHLLLASGTDQGQPLEVYSRRAPDPLFALIEVDRHGDAPGPVQGMQAPTDVAVSADGRHAYAVSIADNAVVAFDRFDTLGFTDDTAGQHLQYLDAWFEGSDGVSGLHKANRVHVSADGKSVFVSSEVGNSIAVFQRLADGRLQWLQVLRDNQAGVTALSGAQGMAMDADSRFLYVAAGFENAIGVFERDPVSLQLAFRGEARGGVAGATGLGGIRDLALTRDGQQLLGVSAIDNAVVVFNLASGMPQFVHAQLAGANRPVAISLPGALDPGDVEHVYIAAENSDELVVMRRVIDPSSPQFGRVQPLFEYQNLVGGIAHMDAPRDIQVSPDGKRVYVAAQNSSSILIFDRDLNRAGGNFGGLALVESRRDDVDGVDGLDTVYALAISADSRNVYAAGFDDKALASFVVGAGSSCSAGGSGSIDDRASIGVGGTVEYRIAARIRADATGVLANTASLLLPDRFSDPDLDDNTATDNTLLVPEGDLSISKTNDQVSVVAGQPVTYEVTVRNPGPSNLRNTEATPVRVFDLLPASAGFVTESAQWTCVASGSGALDFVQSHFDDDAMPGLDALAGVTGLALVPDADGDGPLPGYLAAASITDDALTLLRRDAVDGTLQPVLSVVQGDTLGAGIVASLAGARAVTASSDGRFLYVASRISDAVSVFELTHDAGGVLQLHLRQVLQGVVGLDQALHLVLAVDEAFLYVAGANDNAVAVFARNAGNGQLSHVGSVRNGDPVAGGGTVAGLDNVQFLVASPGGEQLYALSGSGASIARLDINPASGLLHWRSVRRSADLGASLAGASSAVFDASGEYLYLTATGANALVVLERATDAGSTQGALSLAWNVVHASGGAQGLLGPRRAVLSGDGSHLYVVAQSGASVAWFVRDPIDGGLVFLGQRSNESTGVDGLGGATGVVIDDALGQVYVAGTLQGALVHFVRHADSFCPPSGSGALDGVPIDIAAGGSVTFRIDVDVSASLSGPLVNIASVDALQDPNPDNDSAEDVDVQSKVADLRITKDDGLAEFDGLGGASAISGDADHLYVAAALDNAIGVFARHHEPGQPGHGEVSFASVVRTGDDGAVGLAAAADILLGVGGDHVYVASPADNSVAAFDRDRSSGALAFLGIAQNGVLGVSGLSGARALAQSPDGQHVYVAGGFANAIAVFARNADAGSPGYGTLAFRNIVQDGVGGVAGIAAPVAVAASADGRHVYVLGGDDDTLAVFVRNHNPGSSGFGNLVYAGHLADGQAGVTGLGGARSLLLDPTGTHLYVLGAGDAAIALFERDADSGQLSFVVDVRDGEEGISGLAGAGRLRMAADGSVLYVAATGGASVLQFARDPAAGTLAFAGRTDNGAPAPITGGQVLGLDGVADLLPAADGTHLYTVSGIDSALSSFLLDGAGAVDFSAALFDGQGGIAPGEQVTYLIRVHNDGPSSVTEARVVDTFPDAFTSVQWQCTSTGGASCPQSGVGNLDTVVFLPVGGGVTFAATGEVGESASGYLSNTATVAALGASDPNESNNSATDDDTVLSPAVDLVVDVDDGATEATPGANIDYAVTVANLGPSYASGVRVGDSIPAALHDVAWTCSATPVAGVLAPLPQMPGPLHHYSALALSTHGRFAYAAGDVGGAGALALLHRDPLTGALALAEVYANGSDGIAGIAGASDVLLSSDERFVYAAGAQSDAIALFARDLESGELSFVAHYQDGEFGVDGLGGVSDLLFAPGGTHLYAAGTLDDAIAVFAVNQGSGALSQVGLVHQGQPGIDGLNGVRKLAFTEDGAHLLAIAGENQSLSAFARGPNGLLTLADTLQDFELDEDALLDPSALRVDGTRILVASAASDRVSAFAFDAEDGLALQWSIANGVDGVLGMDAPRDLLFDPEQARLYVASADTLHLFSLLGEVPQQLAHYPAASFPASAGIAALAFSPNRRQLYSVSSAPTPGIGVWTRERGSRCPLAGTRQLEGVSVDIAPLGQVVFQVGGRIFANAGGQLDYQVQAAPRSEGEEINAADNHDLDSNLLQPAPDLAVSKSDSRSQVTAGTANSWRIDLANAGVSDALAAQFSDPAPLFPAATAGLLAGSGSFTCAANLPLAFAARTDATAVPSLAGATGLALGVGATHLYAVNPGTGALLQFPRAANGTLGAPQLIVDGTPAGASSIAATADGRHLLVTGATANALAVFAIDGGGALQHVQTLASGSDGVVGLLGAAHVLVSADGRRVFVAAPGSHAIAVFARDADSGTLSFIERVADGLGTILPDSNVIRGVRRLHLSQDGRMLYAVAPTSMAVSSFSVHASSGTLTYLGALRQGSNGISGMTGLRDIAAAPGDQSIYVVGDSALHLLQPQANGALALQHSYTAIPEWAAGRALALDGSGSRLYLADAMGAVQVFARDWNNGLLDLRQRYHDAEAPAPAPQAAIALLHAPGNDLYLGTAEPGRIDRLDQQALSRCLVPGGSIDQPAAGIDLGVGGWSIIDFSATVHPSARGVLSNTATLQPGTGTDPAPLDNSGTDNTTIIVVSDLSVAKTAPPTAIAGETIEYRIDVANAGPSSALGMRVVDPLHAALLDASWTCSATAGSTCPAAGSGLADIAADLLPGGTLDIRVHARIDPAFVGTLPNSVQLVPEVGATDPTPDDTIAAAQVEVTAEVDVSISKSNGVDSVVAGSLTTYLVTVANSGPSDAPQVAVQDLLPAALQNPSWTCSGTGGGSCPAAGSGDVAIQASVPAGGSIELLLQVRVDPAAEGVVENTATAEVLGDALDTNPGNHAATDSDAVTLSTDLALQLLAPLDPYDPAGSVNLPVIAVVANNGPSLARSSVVVLQFSAPVQATRPSGCVSEGPTAARCTIASLAPGAQHQLAFGLGALPDAPGNFTVDALVTARDPDPVAGNDSATRSIALATGGDVRVAIDNGSAVLSPGNAVRYLVEVENVGSQQVDAIALEVPLAAELVGASWTCTASGGASCTASGSGGIADTLVLGSGQRVRYTLDAVVDPALDPLVPRVLAQPVTASVPGGSDFNLGNNSAVDEDLVFYILFRDGFEPPVPLRGPAGSDLLDASECARAGVPAQQCQARSMGDQ